MGKVDPSRVVSDYQKCSSCHASKPIVDFSGKATCDRCRSKKRKHWGSKQVEIAELQDENELLRTALTASRTNNSELNLMIQGQAEEISELRLKLQRAEAGQRIGNCQDGGYFNKLAPDAGSGSGSGSGTVQPVQYASNQFIDQYLPVPRKENQSNIAYQQTVSHLSAGFGQSDLTYNMPYQQPMQPMQPIQPMQPMQPMQPYQPMQSMAPQPIRSEFQMKAEVDCYAQLQDGSLLDYAFEQVLENSSCSFTGSGNGSGAVWAAKSGSGATPKLALDQLGAEMADCMMGLTRYNYVRSLKHGITFDDPELEHAFQVQMMPRRLRVWSGILSVSAIGCWSEFYCSYCFPDEYNFIRTPNELLTLACFMTGLAYWSFSWGDNMKAANFERAKNLGDCTFYVACAKQLHFIVTKCWLSEGPLNPLDQSLIPFILCTHAILMAWAEVHPMGATLAILPLWVTWGSCVWLQNSAYRAIFQLAIIAAFFAWLAFVIYENNRKSFVNQVKLQHAHLVTAELKQDIEQEKASSQRRQHRDLQCAGSSTAEK